MIAPDQTELANYLADFVKTQVTYARQLENLQKAYRRGLDAVAPVRADVVCAAEPQVLKIARIKQPRQNPS